MARTQHEKLDALLQACATLTERSEQQGADIKQIDQHLLTLNSRTHTNTTAIAVIKSWGAAAMLIVPIIITSVANYFTGE